MKDTMRVPAYMLGAVMELTDPETGGYRFDPKRTYYEVNAIVGTYLDKKRRGPKLLRMLCALWRVKNA